ncbi:hypothetical protein [Nocardioides sp.]|uniref:hypothetical protein n=1 Tax=Nocardioides sp. TaxID=35761 RepID=UPI0039E7075A
MSKQQIDTAAIIANLTTKGREAMTAIGRRKVSFFDGGIVEGEGSWGEVLTGDLGHKSSGVLVRLKALGLFDHIPAEEQDMQNGGGWWTLTAAGAAVANALAAEQSPATKAKADVAKGTKAAEKAVAAVKAATRAPRTWTVTGPDATHKCEGACGQTLPLKRFPTTKVTGQRGVECRSCRDSRLAIN